MALINFDCPECGHNLEVDEGGAGFIVKCPECGNPLQIPELPRSHRIRKIAISAATLLAVVALFATTLLLWSHAQSLQKQLEEMKPLGEFLQRAQADAMKKDSEIARLKGKLGAIQMPDTAALADAALAAIEETEFLAKNLEETALRFLKNNEAERIRLLRAEMEKKIQQAKNSLSAGPAITDAEPGRGIGGKQIIFPVLPGPDGQVLRDNAEITGIENDRVFVKYAGGSASYQLTDLHLGVFAYLPVDPLLTLPKNQWSAVSFDTFQRLNAERDQRIAGLRGAIEAHLPAE